jgi:hypothetical protein
MECTRSRLAQREWNHDEIVGERDEVRTTSEIDRRDR